MYTASYVLLNLCRVGQCILFLFYFARRRVYNLSSCFLLCAPRTFYFTYGQQNIRSIFIYSLFIFLVHSLSLARCAHTRAEFTAHAPSILKRRTQRTPGFTRIQLILNATRTPLRKLCSGGPHFGKLTCDNGLNVGLVQDF